MKLPFFFFDLAERMEGEGQTHLYELSYKVSMTVDLPVLAYIIGNSNFILTSLINFKPLAH